MKRNSVYFPNRYGLGYKLLDIIGNKKLDGIYRIYRIKKQAQNPVYPVNPVQKVISDNVYCFPLFFRTTAKMPSNPVPSTMSVEGSGTTLTLE
jgi:hypothetical protein